MSKMDSERVRYADVTEYAFGSCDSPIVQKPETIAITDNANSKKAVKATTTTSRSKSSWGSQLRSMWDKVVIAVKTVIEDEEDDDLYGTYTDEIEPERLQVRTVGVEGECPRPGSLVAHPCPALLVE